jgi:hypothetical protein
MRGELKLFQGFTHSDYKTWRVASMLHVGWGREGENVKFRLRERGIRRWLVSAFPILVQTAFAKFAM